MPKRKSSSPLPFGDFDDDFEDETCSNGSKHNPPIQRNAANARERARMRVLSSAFCRLKTKLPWVPADTKLSKLDTLRLATIYIQQLRSSLTTGCLTSGFMDANNIAAAGENTKHMSSAEQAMMTNNAKASSMVWPFSFPHKLDSIRGSTSAAAAGSTNGNNCSSIGNVHVHGLTHWLTATRLGATTSINPTTALEQHQHNHNDVHLQQEATSCNENGSMNSSRCNYMSNTTAHG